MQLPLLEKLGFILCKIDKIFSFLFLQIVPQEPRPHKFKSTTYHKPTWCDHCGTLLYGIVKQGVQCTDCGINIHHRCKAMVPKTCGHGTRGEPRGRMKVTFSSLPLNESHHRINILGREEGGD